MTLGKKLKTTRLEKGLTLRATSKLTGIHPATLSRIECGITTSPEDVTERNITHWIETGKKSPKRKDSRHL